VNVTDLEAWHDKALAGVEAAMEESGVDGQVARKEGGVLEIELASGATLIVNRHRAAREIWVAAREGGFHFHWDGAAWRDRRDGAELFTALSRLLSAPGGSPVQLRP